MSNAFQPKELVRAQFGNPVLRQECRKLTNAEIVDEKIQSLIKNMQYTLRHKKLGIGLAAPQIGQALAIAVIAIQPTETRPEEESFDIVMINPVVLETKGYRTQRWEGCISSGSGGTADLFAKVPRYTHIKVRHQDEQAKAKTQVYTGLRAQVIQHEIDHLNGVLFVDHVKDTKSYMTYKEYLKAKKAARI